MSLTFVIVGPVWGPGLRFTRMWEPPPTRFPRSRSLAAIWFHQSYAIMPLSLTHPPFQTNTGPAAVLDENNSAGTSF
jgi:hypothetical protein